MNEKIDIQGTITSYIYSLWKCLHQPQSRRGHQGKKHQTQRTKMIKLPKRSKAG